MKYEIFSKNKQNQRQANQVCQESTKLFFEKQMGFVEEYKVMKYFDKIYDRIDEQFCKNVKRID